MKLALALLARAPMEAAAGLGGDGRLYVNGDLVGEGRIDRTIGFRISLDETFDIGADAGEPVSEDYHVPFDFPGQLDRVEVTPDLD